MNQFEKKLLENGSFELICSYVKEHKEILSTEFKNAVTERVKDILRAFDLKVFDTGYNVTISKSKDDILNMNVENFLLRYGYRKPSKLFLAHCAENNIVTAKDLFEFGRTNVMKMHKIGKKTLTMIVDAFEVAGIRKF